MPKQKTQKRLFNIGRRAVKVRAVVAVLALTVLVGGAAITHADKYDDQINAISADSAAKAGIINGLENQAGSYQAAIGQYQAQINDIESKISANEAQQASVQQQITEKQNEVDVQKQYLGQDIRTMYVDGQLTTIEELATSKNLSDYVDKEEYRTSVQNKIDATIKQIAALQAELEKQKAQLDQLVNSEKAQNAQLASAQAQQQQLLSYNQDQQSAYNAQISANSGKIAELRRQQLAANARFIGSIPGGGTPCGGGYPSVWCNAPQDSLIDSWGMYNRECVSYTAFRVAASGRYMPYWGGRGNANQWPGDARAAGIPMDYGGGARVGDVAISTAGAFGHAMYVEAVNGNGTVFVSQYNAALNGLYSTNTVSESGLYFIHF
ncbi:MAG TPA: CHAP domain-containing protein [Candidatus Saccharimonadales bacterium]|nr:CHAP domain-containing protein [Candidatus Saccharimonadales bacterium]